MENILTIDQYIAANMGGQIQKRAKSPLMGLVVLAAGVGLLVLHRPAASWRLGNGPF